MKRKWRRCQYEGCKKKATHWFKFDNDPKRFMCKEHIDRARETLTRMAKAFNVVFVEGEIKRQKAWQKAWHKATTHTAQGAHGKGNGKRLERRLTENPSHPPMLKKPSHNTKHRKQTQLKKT